MRLSPAVMLLSRCVVLVMSVLVATSGLVQAQGVNINLDGLLMNDSESVVETQMIEFFPPCVRNRITNNTTEGFTFRWPGAGPGGFSSRLFPGPNVGTQWEWDTADSVWNIQSQISFLPAPAIPVYGFPGSGVQGINDSRTFVVNGLGTQTGGLLSFESLGSSFITFFSPNQTIATCGTNFVPGRSEQTVTNESDETVTVIVQEEDCCLVPDQTICADGCKDYFTDPENCGGCGIVCDEGAGCNVGCCTGTSNCNGICSDLQTDLLNCGQCGNVCPAGTLCPAGSCEPICDEEAGETFCGDGVCADLGSDPDNCGECGNACDFSECPTGTGLCDGEGGCQCEPEPESDCCDPAGESCSDRVCQDSACSNSKGACCEGWSPYCANLAASLPSCACEGGVVGEGDCCSANGTPGCGEPTCQDIICSYDTYCCAVEWDSICADEAILEPACGCEVPDCCDTGGSTCSDPVCNDAVCDLFGGKACCEEWSSFCAESALEVPECSCPGGGGDSVSTSLVPNGRRAPALSSRSLTAARPGAARASDAPGWTRASDRPGSARGAGRSGLSDRRRGSADRSGERVAQPFSPADGAVTFGDRSGRAIRTGSWPVTAAPVSLASGTDSLTGRSGRRNLRSALPGRTSSVVPTGVDCSLIDFEGIPHEATVGTVPGTPNTTFGPSWTALIDFDDPLAVSDCCADTGTPGCAEPTCEAAVCAIEGFEYCCSVGWDEACVGQAYVTEGCPACPSGNFANEPSPSTAVTFLVANPELLTQNSQSPAENAAAFAAWLADIGITEPEIEHVVDFETGFSDGQNVHGVPGLFPGDLVIYDTGPVSSGSAIVSSTGFGGSNPVGTLSLAHDEEAFLELDFSVTPVDYVAFQDIDQASTSGTVWFVDGSSVPISFETTGFGGDTAEFFGIFRNTSPRISGVQLDATGDGQWGIDTIRYGRAEVPGGADPIDFDAGVQFVEVFYSASLDALPVTLRAWSGPGGSGDVVDSVVGDTVGVGVQGAPCTGDPNGDFCLWDSLQLVSPTNDILSVTLEGATQNQFGFDNMTFCTGVPNTGACCTGESSCVITTQPNCDSLGGSYQGDDALCTPTTCGPPFVVGVVEAGICTAQPLAETLDPGESATICTPGFRAGRQVFTSATIQEGAGGAVLARGPCAQIIGADIDPAGFIPTNVNVWLTDTSGDYLPQPGELLILDFEVLNVGVDSLLSPTAELLSPPDFFNPLALDIQQPFSAYPDFPGLADEDLGLCNPPTEPSLSPQTNLVSYVVQLPPGQAGGATRNFKLVFDGTVPGQGPVTVELPVPFGIGRACDPLGTSGRRYDGLAGFLGPVDADLVPRGYPVNVSSGTFTAGQDILLRMELRCGTNLSDPSSFDPLPQIASITQGTVDLPLTGINADVVDPNNTFFDCGAAECSFNLDTSAIPAGEIVIEVIMPDGRRFRAGLSISGP